MDVFERFSSNHEGLRYIWEGLRKFQHLNFSQSRSVVTTDLVSVEPSTVHSVMECEPCGDLAEEFALLNAQPTVDTVRIDTVKDKGRGIEKQRVICNDVVRLDPCFGRPPAAIGHVQQDHRARRRARCACSAAENRGEARRLQCR